MRRGNSDADFRLNGMKKIVIIWNFLSGNTWFSAIYRFFFAEHTPQKQYVPSLWFNQPQWFLRGKKDKTLFHLTLLSHGMCQVSCTWWIVLSWLWQMLCSNIVFHKCLLLSHIHEMPTFPQLVPFHCTLFTFPYLSSNVTIKTNIKND